MKNRTQYDIRRKYYGTPLTEVNMGKMNQEIMYTEQCNDYLYEQEMIEYYASSKWRKPEGRFR